MQFVIRDLLWLTIVAAMSLGWWLHLRSIEVKHRTDQEELYRAVLEAQDYLKSVISEKLNHGDTLSRPSTQQNGSF